LLFAFFVVLYASAEMAKRKIVELSSAIAGAFQQLGALPKGQIVPKQPALTNLPPRPNTSPGGAVDADALQRELEKALDAELKRHEVEIRVTPEGLVLSLRDIGFFSSGQARLLPSALPKLGRIASILKEHGFDIRVEGHTDNVPIHNAEFRSNWELSTARATQVITLLVEECDLDPLRVAAAGYGEYRPVASNDTPEGRQMNRRIDLVISSHGTLAPSGPEPGPANAATAGGKPAASPGG
jgi:chemotaxis protein MotB